MTVQIGNARINEYGRISGGAFGDQTGKEVCRQSWYYDSRGWDVLRPRSRDVAECIAWNMESACDNDHFGYGQTDRLTGFNEAKKHDFDCSEVDVPVNVDCSELVRICICYALGYEVPDFYTGNEKDILLATGRFELLDGDLYSRSSEYLLRGDTLVTKTKGHTAVVLTDGAKAHDKITVDGSWGAATTSATQELLGTAVDGIVSGQRTLLKKYVPAALTSSWEFSLFGRGSEMIKALQRLIGADADGIMGKKSVMALQTFLKGKGFLIVADGYMGSETVKAWQKYLNEQYY